MVAANKSDLSGVTPREYAQGVSTQVEELMPDMRAPPVVSVCALDGEFGCFLLLFVLNRFTGVQRCFYLNQDFNSGHVLCWNVCFEPI